MYGIQAIRREISDMKTCGIYTLANDTVYDQLVALLNSIEKNIDPCIPVCVIPYNDSLEKVRQEIESRSNVSLFGKIEVLNKWDMFINEVWQAHPREQAPKRTRPGWYQGFVHRKFAAFEGDFDRFIFFDADSLAMKPIDDVLERLDEFDLVFNDWEHAKRDTKTELIPERLASAVECTPNELYPQLHCDSFFGSRKGLIDSSTLDRLKTFLIDEGGIQCVQDRCWWSSSGLFSVMTVKEGFSLFNFTQSSNPMHRTGNCADADPFVTIDGVLYNEDGLKPIHRIHYMNYSSSEFARLCQGEAVDVRYAQTFLDYRFLKEPNKKPEKLIAPHPVTQGFRKLNKAANKVQKIFA